MQIQKTALDALFNPNAIAVIGASDETHKFGNWVSVQALRGNKPVHLVNRTKATVLGQPATESAFGIGEQVDLVAIAVPASGFEAAVDDALAAGAKAIVAFTAGVGESSPEGKRMQDRVIEKVRSAGARLLGPNCLGMLNHHAQVFLTSNEFPVGNIGIISQSGNVALELASCLSNFQMGVSRFVSLGNQSDLDAADIIDAYIDDEHTAAIALYCEDFQDGRRLARAAERAAHHGKPVVLLTVGATAASARNAQSHTGAIVSSKLVVEAACEASGMYQVSTPAQMAELLQALTRSAPPAGLRTAILADGGGHASIASDVASEFGLKIERFSPELSAQVADELPATASTANPIDVAGGGEQDIMCFPRVLAHLAHSPEVDNLLVSGFFGGYGEYGPELADAEIEAAKQIATIAKEAGKPLIVQTMKSDSPAGMMLRESGVTVFTGIHEAARSLGRIASSALAHRFGVPTIPNAATPISDTGYHASRQLLQTAGVNFMQAVEAHSETEVAQAATKLQYPLVLKALGSEHKSDAGGVILGIKDAPTLINTWRELHDRLGPQAFSVEEMADLTDSVELIVGVRRDERFGPIVLVGLGGIYAEILSDVQCALGPVSHDAAVALLHSLRGSGLLLGARGRPSVDIDAVATVIEQISLFAAQHPEISEIECNPIAAGPNGVTALDARIILENY